NEAQIHSPRPASGSSAQDQSKAGQCASRMERARYAPNSGPANRRFAVPGDRAALLCRDQMRKRTGSDHFLAALTSAAPQCRPKPNGITVRESPQLEFCNTIGGEADMPSWAGHVCNWPLADMAGAAAKVGFLPYRNSA